MWIEFVVVALLDETYRNSFTLKSIYNELAKKYKADVRTIERRLRIARESALTDMQEYFNTKHKITNTLFFALLYNKVEKMI